MSIRVLLVDDQELIRKGFRMVLDASNGIEVVGEADDGDTAIELLEHVEADVVLMDVRMPRMSGRRHAACWSGRSPDGRMWP